MATTRNIGAPCWFLVPERQDRRPEYGNGEPQHAGTMVRLLDALQGLAGGATRGLGRDRVHGVWEGIGEFSLRIEVALPEEKHGDLLDVLAGFVRPLGQECLYAVLAGRSALLVYERPADTAPEVSP